MTGIRGSVKNGIKRLLLGLRYDGFVIRRTHGFLVLCYHSIPDSGHWLYDVPRDGFEKHITYLKNRFRIIKAKDLVALTDSHEDTGIPLAITFDDGYEDNYSNALPVLRKHEVPATFFVSSGNIDAGTNRTIKPSENVVKRMMTWAQIQEISEDSLFDIGSHGHNHLNLTKLTPADILEELTESKRDFQSHIGSEPELFSYPGGFHNAQTKSQLEKVGFSCGFTSKQKVNPYQVDCLEVGRIAITQNHCTVASLAYALTHIIRKFPE